MIPRINPNNFTWQIWRGGTLKDVGVTCNRATFIVEKKVALKKYALGYCNAQSLVCRPKSSSMAVMFQNESSLFWTHITIEEFNKVFRR